MKTLLGISIAILLIASQGVVAASEVAASTGERDSVVYPHYAPRTARDVLAAFEQVGTSLEIIGRKLEGVVVEKQSLPDAVEKNTSQVNLVVSFFEQTLDNGKDGKSVRAEKGLTHSAQATDVLEGVIKDLTSIQGKIPYRKIPLDQQTPQEAVRQTIDRLRKIIDSWDSTVEFFGQRALKLAARS